MLAYHRLIPGVRVSYNDEEFVVEDLLDSTHVLIKSIKTNTKDKVDASKLSLLDISSPDSNADLLNIPEEKWVKALQTFKIIEPLVLCGKKNRTRSDVVKIASTSGVNPSTIYRWLNKYEKTGLVSSLIRNGRSDKGKSRLKPEVEDVIQEVIESFYLKDQKPSMSSVYGDVKRMCRSKGLVYPDETTVRNRILAKDESMRWAAREGEKVAKERFQPIRGEFPGADFPLAVVQIDHTPMDVIIVDDIQRLTIGRPYLTLATDVATRMVVGFYLSLDAPGALSVGQCISQSILTKEDYLARLGINLPWPCWGVMRTIHVDNAAEFRGTMLENACTNYGIILEFRPKGVPNYGGHVEREFRTHMKNVHDELPGTTFSDIKEKGEYDSEGRAVMTLDALEKWFTLYILGVYHQKPHSGIDGLPPLVKWEEGIYGIKDGDLGTGIPVSVPNEEKLKLDFLPYFERTIQRYGIQFKGISYWSDALRPYVLAKVENKANTLKKFVCRYDPRNISRIWVFISEDDGYIEVSYRDLTRPAISEWELKDARRRLKERSMEVTNEELIFNTVTQMREIVKVEAEKTKSARKSLQKQKQWKKKTSRSHPGEPENPTTVTPEIPTEDDMDDIGEIVPFENIEEPDFE